MFLIRKNRSYSARPMLRRYSTAPLLAGLLGLASTTTSCKPEWENSRLVYLRNHTGSEALLTWTMPCTRPLSQGRGPLSNGSEMWLVAPEGTYYPRLVQHGRDTLLAGYEHTVPMRVQRLPGDSVAVTITVAAGTRFLVARHTEAYQHSGTDRLEVFEFTLLPGTVRWKNRAGQVCRRHIQPRLWRQAQDVEAEQKQTNSYTLERYFDLY